MLIKLKVHVLFFIVIFPLHLIALNAFNLIYFRVKAFILGTESTDGVIFNADCDDGRTGQKGSACYSSVCS